MSHPSKVDIMIRAVDAGYDVTVYFVCTSDPEINVRRVEQRVSMGGHDVPRERIVARYWRTLDLLCHAALVARRTVLFDNSALVGYRANSALPNPENGLRPVAEVTGNGTDYKIERGFDAPAWVDNFLVRPLHELAQSSDSGITLTIDRKNGSLT